MHNFKRDFEILKCFIVAAFQLHIVLYYCYKTVSNYDTYICMRTAFPEVRQDFLIRRCCLIQPTKILRTLCRSTCG